MRGNHLAGLSPEQGFQPVTGSHRLKVMERGYFRNPLAFCSPALSSSF